MPDATPSLTSAIKAALVDGEFDGLRTHLSPAVVWGDCSSADAVIDMVQGLQAAGLAPTSVQIHEGPDLVTVELAVDGPNIAPFTSHHVMFLEDGLITRIVDAGPADPAPAGDRPPSFAGRDQPARLAGIAPVLPVRNVADALAHYAKLGFETSSYGGDADYGYLKRDRVQIHLTQVPKLKPSKSMSAVYLFVDDARSLYAQWRDAEVGGRLVAPTDTDYGLCEGAHIDPDGNLIRFGSDL